MKKDTGFLWWVWVVITLAGLLHLTRAVMSWNLNVGLWQVPVWFSYLVFVILAYLSYRLFMFLKK